MDEIEREKPENEKKYWNKSIITETIVCLVGYLNTWYIDTVVSNNWRIQDFWDGSTNLRGGVPNS